MIVRAAIERFGLTEVATKYPSVEDLYVLHACKVLQIAPEDVTQHHRRLAKASLYGKIYGSSVEELDRITQSMKESQF